MDKFIITGGKTLAGSVCISGSKNATLPIMAATLLTAEPCEISGVPNLSDIHHMLELLDELGASSCWIKNRLDVNAEAIVKQEARYDIVRKMRATFWVLGPLLSRFGKARVSLPGGCAIGSRPINLHLDGLKAMGAEIQLSEGYVEARVPAGRLKGGHIVLDFPSVGATIHLMLAGALADGTTQIDNAAREPEIATLAQVLSQMGAEITGAGSDRILITGSEKLKGFSIEVPPDRIETATFFAISAATKSPFIIQNVQLSHHDAVVALLEKMGCRIEAMSQGRGDGLYDVKVLSGPALKGVDFKTAPYPGFPTDAQAQFMACMTGAQGASLIEESVFENRFMHTQELTRMGADINIKGNHAVIRGVERLSGAPVMATDLRASASLIIAALAAQGTTEIARIYHLDRGYDRLDEKLRALGAEIERVKA